MNRLAHRLNAVSPEVILAPLAVCIAVAHCRGGVYLGGDAATYVDAARSFLAGQGLMVNNPSSGSQPDLVPLVWFPPGLPLLIAGVSGVVGVDPTRVSWCVGLISYILLLALCVRMARVSFGSATAWTLGALLVLSPRVWSIATGGLSEMPFAVAILAAVLATGIEASGRRVAIIATSIAAAVYLRYVGVFLFPAMIAVSVMGRTRLSLRQALLACAAAALAVIPLFVRNLLVTSTIGGERPVVDRSFLENLSDAGVGVANLFLPQSIFSSFAVHLGDSAASILGLILVVGALWLLILPARIPVEAAPSEQNSATIRALSIVSVSYLLVLVALSCVIYFDPLKSERLLLPLLPALELVAARALVGAWARKGAPRLVAVVAGAGFAVMAAVLAVRGTFLREGYPDLEYISGRIQSHVPSGSCLAFEEPGEDYMWSGTLVRERLRQYRLLYIPDAVFRGAEAPRALTDWSQTTGCRYLVSIARPLRGATAAGPWTYPERALARRLESVASRRPDGAAGSIAVIERDSRISILRVDASRPSSP